jgi:3-dehydroquinate synthase/2-deoxy-scyllo-inosose synthase
MGHLGEDAVRIHGDLLARAGAPMQRPAGTDNLEIMEKVLSDNKRGHLPHASDLVPMVLLGDLGSPLRSEHLPLVPVPPPLVEQALEVIDVGAGDRIDPYPSSRFDGAGLA